MANPLDRTWYSTLVDDDGSGTTGTIWNKAAVDSLLDSVDASLANVVDKSGTPALNQIAVFADADSIKSNGNVAADPSGGLLLYSPTYAYVQLTDASQPANQRLVRISNSGGIVQIRPLDDIGGDLAGTAPINVLRTGRLDLPGGQISFPATQVPSADPNTLDDYKEGPFTPSFGATGGATGQTYYAQTGRFIKKGRDVTCWGHLALSAKGTIAFEIIIANLPYMADNTSGDIYFVGTTVPLNLQTAWATVNLRLSPGTNYAYLFGSRGGPVNSFVSMVDTDLSPSTIITFQISYQTAQ